jgi:hypothetical protein
MHVTTMRAWFASLVLVACSSHSVPASQESTSATPGAAAPPSAAPPPAVPPPAAAMPPIAEPDAAVAKVQLPPIARTRHPLVVVQGRDRVALSLGEQAWITVDEHGFHDEPQIAKSLAAAGQHLTGDGMLYFFGRTPSVANDDRRVPGVGRANAKKTIAAPGVIRQAIAFADGHELWRYSTERFDRIALVDPRDHVTPIAPLPVSGAPPAGIRPELCAEPSVFRIARSGDAIAALVMDCNAETPPRIQTIRSDGNVTTRTLHAVTEISLEPNQFAITSTGTAVLAGIHGGRLAIARAAGDGSWSAHTYPVPDVETTAIAIGADDAVWTITLGQGPDHHDLWQLERDGAVVELADPSGKRLSPHDLGVDARLGVVVVAVVQGDLDAPSWVLAEHPLPGALRDLP